MDRKQEVRGGGGGGGSEAGSWPGSPCIWQDPTVGAGGGLIVIRAGKAAIHQNDARGWSRRGVVGWEGFKANSADILSIAAATQNLLPLSIFAGGGQRSRIGPTATTWWRLAVWKCFLMRQKMREVKVKREEGKKEKRCIWSKRSVAV